MCVPIMFYTMYIQQHVVNVMVSTSKPCCGMCHRKQSRIVKHVAGKLEVILMLFLCNTLLHGRKLLLFDCNGHQRSTKTFNEDQHIPLLITSCSITKHEYLLPYMQIILLLGVRC